MLTFEKYKSHETYWMGDAAKRKLKLPGLQCTTVAPKQSLPLLKDQIVPDHHLTLDKSKHTKPFHAPSKISCVCESFKR